MQKINEITNTTVLESAKLYKASSILSNFEGHENVTMEWFCTGRDQKLGGYAERIDRYQTLSKESQRNVQPMVEERFTGEEIKALKAYLQKQGVFDLKIEEVPLPIDISETAHQSYPCSFTAIPVGGDSDFIMLHRRKNYYLPFKVEGYFNLQNCPRKSPIEELDNVLDEIEKRLVEHK